MKELVVKIYSDVSASIQFVLYNRDGKRIPKKEIRALKLDPILKPYPLYQVEHAFVLLASHLWLQGVKIVKIEPFSSDFDEDEIKYVEQCRILGSFLRMIYKKF